MIQNVLTHISGIGLYGVLSLCLFFGCFVGTLWWAARLKKSYLDTMRSIPLDEEPGESAGASAPAEPESCHD